MSANNIFSTRTVKLLHTAATSVMLTGMVVSIFYQVISRYFLKTSLVWSEELGRFFFVWMVFMGLSYVELYDEPIKITIIRDLAPKPVRICMDALAQILSFVFCCVCVYYGFERVNFMFGSGQILPGLKIDMAWFYMAIPVGFTLTCLAYIVRFANWVKTVAARGKAGKEGC